MNATENIGGPYFSFMALKFRRTKICALLQHSDLLIGVSLSQQPYSSQTSDPIRNVLLFTEEIDWILIALFGWKHGRRDRIGDSTYS